MSAADAFCLGMAAGAFTAGIIVIYAAATLMADRWRG
jgi:hypothetical protein